MPWASDTWATSRTGSLIRAASSILRLGSSDAACVAASAEFSRKKCVEAGLGHVFAGQATAAHPPAGLALHSITPADLPLEQALPRAAEFLANSVREAFA